MPPAAKNSLRFVPLSDVLMIECSLVETAAAKGPISMPEIRLDYKTLSY